VFRVLLAFLLLARLLTAAEPEAAVSPRTEYDLCRGWLSMRVDSLEREDTAFMSASLNDTTWPKVDVPHTWDGYAGVRMLRHGNLHGSAWYRKTIELPEAEKGRRIFLFFEGVGSYATVWLNGEKVGTHAGGLTTFTIDVTAVIKPGKDNLLVVKAEHPPGIRDLPWVCGGCERAGGFSEGPQPFGLFRPVRMICTGPLRIEPFGVHVWNDANLSEARAVAKVETSLRNYGKTASAFTLRTRVLDQGDKVLAESLREARLEAGAATTIGIQELAVSPVQLWNVGQPKLYRLESALLGAGGELLDRTLTEFGFRSVDWPRGDKAARGTLLVNGKPVFLDGICEYPHLLGGSYAFAPAQVAARVSQIEAAGFNAFRDAHHPHDLRYNEAWDRDGLAWWPQFSAHIWFDRDDFRKNFLALLGDWVRERRNSPSLILWGLQNESQLPDSFARECVALIRKLDPTAGTQRLVTTCNSGTGTDWDVPQNWSGTYAGDPAAYAEDLKRELLFGEYGGWRSVDFHSEQPGATDELYSEEQQLDLLDTKLKLAHQVRDKAIGHFLWIFATHENPGRSIGSRGEQGAEGRAWIDRVGPANNKGLFTLWGEPTDAYAMYRSFQVSGAKQPMVQIAGATWPDRCEKPGNVARLSVFSNCDSVELFNDIGGASLGVREKGAYGEPFVWENVPLRYRLLHAVGKRGGLSVAEDTLLLNHLPPAPNEAKLDPSPADSTAPAPGYGYLYRVNCGGPDYQDSHGQLWRADRVYVQGDRYGSLSWASEYPSLDPIQASARRIHTPVTGTKDPDLYSSFRYGREQLRYVFRVPDGDYRVELHFAEPWYGRGGGIDAKGWRLFDVAVNGKTLIENLDLFAEAGFGRALRKDLDVKAVENRIEISFPKVTAGQAVLCAVAIASKQPKSDTWRRTLPIAAGFASGATDSMQGWLDTGRPFFADAPDTISSVPARLVGQSWIQRGSDCGALDFYLTQAAVIYVAVLPGGESMPASWEACGESLGLAGTQPRKLALYRNFCAENARVSLPASVKPAGAVIVPLRPLPPPQTLRDLQVTGASGGTLWRAQGGLREGTRIQGERAPALGQLPQELGDADWLLTPAFEKSGNLSLRMGCTDSCEVFVGIDARTVELPAWLADWTEHSATAKLGDNTLRLFKKRFASGEDVVLGAAPPDGPMYAVFARLVKPSSTYNANGTVRLSPEKPSCDWNFSVGVGDRYDLCFACTTELSSPLKLQMEIYDANGTKLGLREAEFQPGKRSRTLRLRTPTSINAGEYRARLILVGPGRLEIETLTVE
jgi:hypothetical protein